MQIQNTKEYDKFETIIGNRIINNKKVQKLVEDVTNGLNLFEYCPIIVTPNENGKLKIIDGQHRFTASEFLKLPVYYVVAKNIELRDIARMNSNTDKWKFSDFMQCYIELGIEDYKIFKEFITKWKLNYAPAIGLLMANSAISHGSSSDKFKDGKFRVNHLEEATATMEIVARLFDRFVFRRDRFLIHAIAKLEEKGIWEIDRFEEKLNKNPNQMNQCTSHKTYILLIEQIYNTHTQNRKIIY